MVKELIFFNSNTITDYIYFFFTFFLLAVQNERDRISRKPVEEQDKKYGLTTQLLLSAEILSRPAQSPPGELCV